MCEDCFHIVSLFLSNPCTPSTLSKEAFVYFVCPTEIPQPPFAWKYYLEGSICVFCVSHRHSTTSLRVEISRIPFAIVESPSRS